MLEKECDQVLPVMRKSLLKGNVPDFQKLLKKEGINISDEDLGTVLAILCTEDLVEGSADLDKDGKIIENSAKMSITLKGISFIKTETFVDRKKRRDLDKKTAEQQLILIQSTIETNKISKTTNIYVAIFTGVAGMYYLKEMLDYAIPVSKNYNKIETVIVLTLSIPISFVIVYTALRRSLKQYRKRHPQSE